jgi:hypothetical protein
MEHLVKRWEVADRTGLSGEAAKEQEYLVGLPSRIRKLSERVAGIAPLTFSSSHSSTTSHYLAFCLSRHFPEPSFG